jgi:hypothetical protein
VSRIAMVGMTLQGLLMGSTLVAFVASVVVGGWADLHALLFVSGYSVSALSALWTLSRLGRAETMLRLAEAMPPPPPAPERPRRTPGDPGSKLALPGE